ncbi:unnamed protein product [Rotaria socialis]|uniref:DDE-1 domain-containing protein n=1 Tax=Rotaria socialis TaxID=392032 RepID=A0A817W417_9BILA|nr:unnamed protein product [Rotaria socialis]CAF4643121.1 unnamed protein product [Rotaria socialis]
MLDDVMTMTDVTNESPDDEEKDDDGEQQAQIHISTTSAVDPTTNPIHSKASCDNKDKSIEGASSRRRSWTIQEKLNAFNAFKKCKNISLVSRQHHCDRKQLREWLNKEQQLLLIKNQSNRKTLKRLKGAGAKICHKELDQQLIKWFALKRTNPDDETSTAPTEIKKERITFKNLVCHGEKICLSLKIQPYPSKMRFCRFLKRHNLSLQKPKRQQKITFSEAHSDNSRVGPALLFKGKGRVSEQEKKQYDKSVKVYFSTTAFINSSIMKNYTEHLLNKTRDGRPKMFITDSCSCHFNEDVKALFKKNSVVLGIIPGGITQYIQVLDIFVFSTYKAHYHDVAEEWIEVNGLKSTIKLTCSQQRILCTRLASTTWKRTLNSVNVSQSFRNLGYTWIDNSVVTIKSLPGYSFDPASLNFGNDIEDESSLVEEIDKVMVMEPVRALKQSSLLSFWNK